MKVDKPLQIGTFRPLGLSTYHGVRGQNRFFVESFCGTMIQEERLMPEREKQSLCCLPVLTFISPLWIYFVCLIDCFKQLPAGLLLQLCTDPAVSSYTKMTQFHWTMALRRKNFSHLSHSHDLPQFSSLYQSESFMAM